MSEIWNLFIINPMTNALLWLTGTLGGNFILALVIFTIITRVIMLPLNLRQQRSMMKTQEMQPQIKAIQSKYKDNPQKMQEEFAKIGYNPADTLTGCLPMVATMPILFGLFQVLRLVLGTTPQALFELTQRVYPWIDLTKLLPIDSTFLWLNLAQPDPLYILPVLVFATMFLQTKMTTPAANKNDDKKNKGKDESDPSAAMSQSMQYTMPIMFGFFSLSFSSGLSIYFVLSNLVGIGQGWYTRRVMAQEKEAQEQKKKLQKMGMFTSSAEAAAMDGKEAAAVSAAKSETREEAKNSGSAASESNGSAQQPAKKKKKQSKRKKKSKR